MKQFSKSSQNKFKNADPIGLHHTCFYQTGTLNNNNNKQGFGHKAMGLKCPALGVLN